MGLRFVAAWQTVDILIERISRGQCYLAYDADRLIGTITLYPGLPDTSSEYYKKPGVWVFGQFTVDPDYRGKGIGSLLIKFGEETARNAGATEMSLDTAIPALHLIRYYEKHGYTIVEEVQWQDTNYPSVIMAKTL